MFRLALSASTAALALAGGEVRFEVEDCAIGNSEYSGRVSRWEPSIVKLGEESDVTVYVNTTTDIADGSFDWTTIALGIPIPTAIDKDFCGANVDFDLPLKSGSVHLQGPECPIPKGNDLPIKFTFGLSEMIPTVLDRLEIQFRSKDQDSNKVLCANLRAQEVGCNAFFGNMDGAISITDSQIPQSYCESHNVSYPCTFVHYAGRQSHCEVPAPLGDDCHSYIKVTYDNSCFEFEKENQLSGKLDTDNLFNKQGKYKQCKDKVQKIECYGWKSPADAPQKCDVNSCPTVAEWLEMQEMQI